ncbi:MAG: membrane protein insertion efficiency factor YidD [Chitinispirillaceae bacterium]|nr:membrane protein insertion efficiency factor YidD [Chitinispirillaceae bacterium]
MSGKILSVSVIILIRLYQWMVSPLLPTKCRYTPTCSDYMILAIREWGFLRGAWLGIKRIGRCRPCGGWGEDAVPGRKKITYDVDDVPLK